MNTPVKNQNGWLRYVPPAAALGTAFVLQVIIVTDTLGGALAKTDLGRFGWALGILFGLSVASCAEGGAAYLMDLYDRHLLARDSVWLLRLAMVVYVAGSAAVIHWWAGTHHLPGALSWLLAGMSASALFLWSRGARWRNRQQMVAAGQIDPALPRLPMSAKVLHPVRWLVTLYLISWSPVAKTDQARARYDTWSANRSWRRAYRTAERTGGLYVGDQVVAAMVVASTDQAIRTQLYAEQAAATMLEEARDLADAILDGARRELDEQRTNIQRQLERATTQSALTAGREQTADQVLREANAQATEVRAAAEVYADQLRDQATDDARELVRAAEERADRLVAAARRKADEEVSATTRANSKTTTRATTQLPVRRTPGLPTIDDLTNTLVERFEGQRTPGRPSAEKVLREVFGSCSPDRARQAIEQLRVRRGEQPADTDQERLQEPQWINGTELAMTGASS